MAISIFVDKNPCNKQQLILSNPGVKFVRPNVNENPQLTARIQI